MKDYRDLLSGNRRGGIANAQRGILWLLSQAYRLATNVRNARFDQGLSPAVRCGVPVICVGNLTTGGTGKTPVVCDVTKRLRRRGKVVAIVSRGYGRGKGDHNDEALEVRDRLPDVPHIQDPDRVSAARSAVAKFDSQVIVMDDGYQHRRLHRDLNILLIDATCPFGFGHLLPRGLLREPISGARRADVIMLTRCRLVDSQRLTEIQSRLTAVDSRIGSEVPVVRSNHQPTGLRQHPDRELPIETIRGADVAMLCGIGNPKAFWQSLREIDVNVVDSLELPDHDRYEPETVRRVIAWLRSMETPPSWVICTHKDLVKLGTDRLGGVPLAAVLIDCVLLSGEQDLEDALDRVCSE